MNNNTPKKEKTIPKKMIDIKSVIIFGVTFIVMLSFILVGAGMYLYGKGIDEGMLMKRCSWMITTSANSTYPREVVWGSNYENEKSYIASILEEGKIAKIEVFCYTVDGEIWSRIMSSETDVWTNPPQSAWYEQGELA